MDEVRCFNELFGCRLVAATSVEGRSRRRYAQEDYSPLLARLRPLRNEITLRGPLASIEKILNLSGASALLCGVTHTPYLATMAGALEALIEPWKASSAWVLQGSEGHVDFSGR